MHQRAGRRPGEEVADHDDAVLGHEHVAQFERFRAAAEEAQHLPVIDDLDFGERHQQIGDRPRVAHLAQKGADDRPLRMVAAARKGVMPAEPPAAGDAPGGGARRQRGRGDGLGVVAPHVDLRLLRDTAR